MSVDVRALTAEEIVELCRRHTLFDWQAQAGVDPIPVDHAKGVEFWTIDGKRYLDFNSQLWSRSSQATQFHNSRVDQLLVGAPLREVL